MATAGETGVKVTSKLFKYLYANVPVDVLCATRLLRLDEYVPALLAQGYGTVDALAKLPWEDMEDAGIVRLGHQKKLLLAIKRVRDIAAGKWPPTAQEQEELEQQMLQQQQQQFGGGGGGGSGAAGAHNDVVLIKVSEEI